MEDTPDTKPRKRKQRAILSCNDCRRRKLKCDRELPCNRCINGGISEKCAYGMDAQFVEDDYLDLHHSKRTRQPSALSTDGGTDWTTRPSRSIAEDQMRPAYDPSEMIGKDRVAQLESRIATLEALLSSLQHNSEHDSLLPAPAKATYVEESSVAWAGLFKGRDYRTFYYGATCPMTIIAHFPDLRPFMKRVYVNSTLERLRQDEKWAEEKARLNKASNKVLSVSNLRNLLPDRATVDKVVKTYFESFETTYRILHTPTFWSKYQTYWDTPPAPNSEMDAIVLAILACTLCISTHERTRYDINGSIFRGKAIVWIKACEAWLRRHSNKHRTLSSLQVRCLRLLALSTTCVKTKEYYSEVQAHMAFMKSSGMHKDPNILGARCSIFEGEMRRRLWATSVELELQASIDKGIPSVLSGLEYDCAPPRNINDSDLQLEMKHLPESQPIATFTNTSFLHCSMQSISLRVKLCALANALQPKRSFEEALRDEEELQNTIERIPAWKEPQSPQTKILLDLQLRQFLVIIHTQRVLHAQLRRRPDYRYSALACLDASAALIELHSTLLEKRKFALCCIRSDYLRASLIICHIAYHARLANNSTIARVAKSAFDDTMDKAFRLLEERSLRPGRGNHQYWILSAACSLVGTQFDPSRAPVLERQASDRVCKLLYKILSLQDDPTEEGLAQEVLLVDGTSSNPTIADTSIDTSSYQWPDSFANPVPRLDDFNDPGTSSWMLEDFWFMNDFPLAEFNEKFDLHFLSDLFSNVDVEQAVFGNQM